LEEVEKRMTLPSINQATPNLRRDKGCGFRQLFTASEGTDFCSYVGNVKGVQVGERKKKATTAVDE
jgi:hypothetical protein